MAFTDLCDLYVAIHENGVNRMIDHITRQRPSMFNYGTADVAANREVWCANVEPTPDVTKYGNPIFSVEPPLPVFGADSPPVALGFCGQVPRIEIDFFPTSVFDLPPELGKALKPQQFALRVVVCGAVECPPAQEIDTLPVPVPNPTKDRQPGKDPPVVLRGRLECFCVELFVVGHFQHTQVNGVASLAGIVDDMDIVDIEPPRLEQNVICYLRTTIAVVLREKLTIPLASLSLSFPLFGLATVTAFPTPVPDVPNNPAVEDDQLKAFVSITVV
jgi:hypothetical protein